jgi:hypothetical protein
MDLSERASIRPAVRTALAAVLVGLVAAALGAPYGLLWSVVAPDIPLVKVEGGVAPVDPAPEQMVAGDGWFSILGVLFGVVAALAAWWLARRHRGPVVLGAMALGAVVAGVFAAWLGQKIGLAGYQEAVAAAAPGTAVNHPPDLRIAETGQWLGFVPKATGVQLVAAFAAAVTYTLLAGWSRYPALRPEAPDAGEQAPPYGYPVTAGEPVPPEWAQAWRPPSPNGQSDVSSGSPAPPAPPAAPARPGPGEAASPPD